MLRRLQLTATGILWVAASVAIYNPRRQRIVVGRSFDGSLHRTATRIVVGRSFGGSLQPAATRIFVGGRAFSGSLQPTTTRIFVGRELRRQFTSHSDKNRCGSCLRRQFTIHSDEDLCRSRLQPRHKRRRPHGALAPDATYTGPPHVIFQTSSCPGTRADKRPVTTEHRLAMPGSLPRSRQCEDARA